MNYERPQIHVIGPAVIVVKGMNKGTTTPTDNRQHLSPAAYEADE